MSSLDEIILSSYGGLEHNSLSNLIDDNDEVTEPSTVTNIPKRSPYFDLEHLTLSSETKRRNSLFSAQI